MTWQNELRALGGAASTKQLRAAGASEQALTSAVASGMVRRPRKGRYLSPGAGAEVERAVRAGARLSCVSAARSYGLWGGQDGRTHLVFPPHAGRAVPEGHRHWWRCGQHPEIWRVSLADCLRTVVRCADEETAVAVLDTALASGRVSMAGLARVFAWESQRSRRVATLARPGSESGVESILRQRLGRRHLVEQQLAVPGVGRVDMRVDGVLYVEVDGFAYHSDRDAFEQDRLRDAGFALRGARWLRVSARQVLEAPDDVIGLVEAVLEREEESRDTRVV